MPTPINQFRVGVEAQTREDQIRRCKCGAVLGLCVGGAAHTVEFTEVCDACSLDNPAWDIIGRGTTRGGAVATD